MKDYKFAAKQLYEMLKEIIAEFEKGTEVDNRARAVLENTKWVQEEGTTIHSLLSDHDMVTLTKRHDELREDPSKFRDGDTATVSGNLLSNTVFPINKEIMYEYKKKTKPKEFWLKTYKPARLKKRGNLTAEQAFDEDLQKGIYKEWHKRNQS